MASFSMVDFVGNGSLRELLPKLLDEGWDDVPTLKVMNLEDMNHLGMTRQQQNALEIRSYLHDHALMHYSDQLEASQKGLRELLSLSNIELASQFGMKRGHVARFMGRTRAFATDPQPAFYTLPERRRNSSPSRNNNLYTRRLPRVARSAGRSNPGPEVSIEQSVARFNIKDGHVFKGIVAAGPAEPRACGCIRPPSVVENVAAYSSIENVLVQKLTPDYKMGMDRLIKSTAPPMKASELCRDKPAILVCFRRLGCVMCRAQAHQFYSNKPTFDALGVQLFAVLHEHIESEVRDFWPRYWGGVILFDRGKQFFKALGGGKLLKDNYISGCLLNPIAMSNYKRARASGMQQNFKGKGEIKGGVFILGSGKSGIAYQFIERNFGDWAPLAEVVEICSRISESSAVKQTQQNHSKEGEKTSTQSLSPIL